MAAGPDRRPGGSTPVHLLVFVSGAAALIYEVVWSRQLATFLGITSHAHTAVLATFMLGLALGSRMLGPVADRSRDPLRLFGLLEAGIGCYAAGGLWLVPALQRLYAALTAGGDAGGAGAHALRFAMAAAALLVPTFLMGGTLPALVRAVNREFPRLARSVASIYGVNTLGAAAGAFAAGYLLLPALGIRATTLLAVACNLAVAVTLLTPLRVLLGDAKPRRAAAEPPAAPAPLPARARTLVLVGFAASGFAALALQLAWVRAMTLVLGSSVYAFSITLAAYLVGIALGSLLFAALLARRLGGGGRLAWAAGLETAAGLAALLGLPLIGRLPGIFIAGYRAGVHQSFPLLQLFGFALAAAVILVPTVLLGMLFPLLTALCGTSEERIGSQVGTAYAANSLGTILGAVTAGLWILPALGAHGTVVAMAGLHVAVGGLFVILRRAGAPARRGLLLAAGSLAAFWLVALALPPWDRAVMTSGPFINASRIADVPDGLSFREWIGARNRLLFYREGAEATVTVRDFGEERMLVINGKTDGTRILDRKTQMALAHLPLLMHERPGQVLIIGLGTGMTAASAAAHDPVARLEVVEISPEVVAASALFATENRGVLLDPRLELVEADARNFLLGRRSRWDVIISEPSNPWISGVANLFTLEFFELAARRLAPDGVMAQWFHTYAMAPEDWRSVLATFAAAFPQVSVWTPQLGDVILIGSHRPHGLRLARLTALQGSPLGLADLLSAELPLAADFARMLLLAPDEVAAFTGNAALNTDDHPRVEFHAARNLYSETTMANALAVVEHLDGRASRVPMTGLAGTDAGGRFRAFGLALEAGPEAAPRADWLVTWSAAVLGDADALPRLLVGNRRVISLELDGGPVEILRAVRATEPDAHSLLDELTGLAPGEVLESGRFGDGPAEVTVWVAGREATGPPFVGLGWTCGEAVEGFTSFTAFQRAPPTGAASPSVAALAPRIRCVGD